jgi:hypothetical protein
MGVRTLESLFGPKSIAVLGASNTPHQVGTVTIVDELGKVHLRELRVSSVVCFPKSLFIVVDEYPDRGARLRLSPQARLDPKTVARQRDVGPRPRLWES